MAPRVMAGLGPATHDFAGTTKISRGWPDRGVGHDTGGGPDVTPMRHVIIGNGPAGVIAAETLRAQRPADDIVLVGDEPEPPYSRMAIPYLLAGDIGEAGDPPAQGRGPLRQAPHHPAPGGGPKRRPQRPYGRAERRRHARL